MTRETFWLDRLTRLRVDPDKGKGRAPHKPLLLLAVSLRQLLHCVRAWHCRVQQRRQQQLRRLGQQAGARERGA